MMQRRQPNLSLNLALTIFYIQFSATHYKDHSGSQHNVEPVDLLMVRVYVMMEHMSSVRNMEGGIISLRFPVHRLFWDRSGSCECEVFQFGPFSG